MPPIESLRIETLTIPTQGGAESDGTLVWDHTTVVLVEIDAGGETGLGWTYAHGAVAQVISDTLAPLLTGQPADDIPRLSALMHGKLRNNGLGGLSAMAISAVDIALWDGKARRLGMALARLFGLARDGVPVYGSGGFTSQSVEELRDQLGGWARAGLPAVKMKVGRDAASDAERVAAARGAIGPDVQLFLDANEAWTPKEALRHMEAFARHDVRWMEQPVDHRDLAGMAEVRARAPAAMEVSSGEYGWRPADFLKILQAGAVDVLQADVTRCGGYTGFLRVAALAEAFKVPLSCHCAPALHLPVACASPMLRHLEWFHDHVRIERECFDGAPQPDENGVLRPDLKRPGHGLRRR
ncbi:MAG: enolase C-terminal domain-like protein [Sumerlaeia bacterium]